MVWNSGDPISSPCFCRVWLFYLGEGLIKAVLFLHIPAVLSLNVAVLFCAFLRARMGWRSLGGYRARQGA